MRGPLLSLLLLVSFFTCNVYSKNKRQIVKYPPVAPGLRTRSLSGTYATDGDPLRNKQIYDLITLTILKGFAIFRIKGYNDRSYLDRYRRSYWFGTRHYYMDNKYYLATRDTCAYQMTPLERRWLEYEDGTPIHDIVYQCQRFVEYCCGLDCCRNVDLGRVDRPTPMPRYPWLDWGWRSGTPSQHAALLPLPLLLLLLILTPSLL